MGLYGGALDILAEGSGVSDGEAGRVDREEFFGGFFCHPL